MGTYMGHLYIITICVTFLWVGLFWLVYEAFRFVLKGKRVSRAERIERARRMADRRG